MQKLWTFKWRYVSMCGAALTSFVTSYDKMWCNLSAIVCFFVVHFTSDCVTIRIHILPELSRIKIVVKYSAQPYSANQHSCEIIPIGKSQWLLDGKCSVQLRRLSFLRTHLLPFWWENVTLPVCSQDSSGMLKSVCEVWTKAQRAQNQSQEIVIRVVFFKTDLLYLQKNVQSKDWPNQQITWSDRWRHQICTSRNWILSNWLTNV